MNGKMGQWGLPLEKKSCILADEMTGVLQQNTKYLFHRKGMDAMDQLRNTPFWDTSLSNEQRIDWLLSAMTIEEKLGYLASWMPEIARLGVPGCGLGGEAAHGVEARNDQNGIGTPDITTSFVQPIGMSASWDPALVQKAGEVVGTEARVVNHRHPQRGLSRWAPTVDLERDPRWGRNEEGYGEDPVLTGAMAGAYVKGMQGEDPKYLRIAATLKHFYGNNTEDGRAWKNATIDPRNRYELYLEPFRRCIEDAGAQGIMTAYNRINGTVGILNPEVNNILKKQYGLTHAVGDGGALGLVVTLQHYFGTRAEAVAAAVKAGVDGMSDHPGMVAEAAKEAYSLGLLTEADLDKAIRSKLEVAMRLGVYDREGSNPFDRVTEEDILTEESRNICLQLSREAVVLLKNEGQLLPLDKDMASEDLAVVGPLGDIWYQDWYGGEPPQRTTLLDGLKQLGKNPVFADSLDRVKFTMNGKPLALGEDDLLHIAEEGDVFIKENWGEGSFTFRSVRTGKFLSSRLEIPLGEKPCYVAADRTATFDWFVTERFFMEQQEDGSVILLNRFHDPLEADEEGRIFSSRITKGMPVRIELVEDGMEKALETIRGKKAVVLALGCNSMLNAKEEIDRTTLCLPPDQEELVRRIAESGVPCVMTLFTNYPYTINEAQAKLPAILMSAAGAQDMGLAMAETIFGLNAPAGRLNMTWYKDVSQLPSIDDYDIIKGKRTYRYFDGEVLYPFGFGLTYAPFVYDNLSAKHQSGMLKVRFTVKNAGDCVSDEVAQLYAVAPASRVKKPLRQLIGFERLKNVAPGESRLVEMNISADELRFYDVVSQSLMVEEGEYTLFAGPSSAEKAAQTTVFVPGRKPGLRNMAQRVLADHYDDYENISLVEGNFGLCAATLQLDAPEGWLSYRDCDFSGENSVLSLHMKSETGCTIEVYVDGRLAGSWEGDTRTCEHRSAPQMDRLGGEQVEIRNRYRSPIYEDIEIDLSSFDGLKAGAELRLRLKGDVKLCYMKMLKGKAVKKINLGVAN